jgi:hypothetical protein
MKIQASRKTFVMSVTSLCKPQLNKTLSAPILRLNNFRKRSPVSKFKQITQIRGKNLLRPISNVWVSIGRYTLNSQLLNEIRAYFVFRKLSIWGQQSRKHGRNLLYCLPDPDFHETHEWAAALCADILYRIPTKSDVDIYCTT